MYKIMILTLIFFISFSQMNAQIMQSTVVKPVEKVDVPLKTKEPAVTWPLVRLPEIVLTIDRVDHTYTTATVNFCSFRFKAAFKNLTNFPGYRWIIEEYNKPPRVLDTHMFTPYTADSVKIALSRDSMKTDPIKIWCEVLSPGPSPVSSNKIEF